MTADLPQRDEISRRILESLARAQAHARSLRQRNNWFVYLSLIAGALGTIISGMAAATGPLAGPGPHGWKLTCALAAGLTGCATVFAGLNQQLALADRLARATVCLGRLHALSMGLTVGTPELVEIGRQYQEVVANYQEFIV